jgi:hypothetical protein
MKNFRIHLWVLAAFLLTGGPGLGEDLALPENVAEIMSRAGTAEYDGYYPSGETGQPMVDYVKANWSELLDNLKEVPSAGKSKTSAAMLLGRIAEELPPEDYLEFMAKYLDAYEKGDIPTNIVALQIAGSVRKEYFFAVNFEDARAKSIISRAKSLAPEKETDFRAYMDELMSGKLADMYLANESDDAPRPETLPGIKLRAPFASLIEKAKRMGKINDGAQHRPDKVASDSGTVGVVNSPQNKAESPWRIWAIAVALALLGVSMWKVIAKRRVSSL